MSSLRSNWLKVAFLSASVAAVSSAEAGATWTLDATTPAPITCTGGAASMDCAGNQDAGGVKTHMSAWSATTGAAFAAASLGSWDGAGFGVSYTGEVNSGNNHSMDNSGQTDAILLRFDQAVSLNTVRVGWSAGDSDISVLRFVPSVGNTNGQTALDGDKLGNSTLAGSLINSGWSLVGNMSLAASQTGGTATFNAANLTSSWWLISAYNGAYGGTQLDSNADYVKLLAVGSNAVIPRIGVPEPASLALAGVALVAMAGAGRRRKSKQI